MRVTATALGPLALGTAPQAGNLVDGHDHVPGSVLRGALASRWVRENGPPLEAGAAAIAEFAELFEGNISYGRLSVEGSALLPLSVLRCKYRPDPRCRSVALDAAAGEEPPRRRGQPVCPLCENPLDAGRGQVVWARRWQSDGSSRPAVVEVTRTRLSDVETASDGDLFTRRALPTGVTLSGRIRGQHPWLADLDTDAVWFGGRRSTAGRVRITTAPDDRSLPLTRDDGRITIRLDSPGIFVDPATRPLLDFPYDEIASVLGCPVRPERRWLRTGRVGGWHSASGLPKPQETVLVAGSVVVLLPEVSVPAEQLATLESEGIGLRRAEGFGEVRVNPPPWRPPADESPTELPDALPALIANLESVVADRSLAGWLADQLRERAVAVEQRAAVEAVDVGDARRLRAVPPSTRDAVVAALSLDDPALLRDLLALVEDLR